jgi:hypothetical protein
MKKIGKTLTGLALLASLAFSPKAEAQRIVNPFIQPNNTNLNWYGSGDVNNDNVVNWEDVSKMEEIINGSYNPNLKSNDVAEYRTLDRADVNGDGVVNYEDKEILENKLNENVDYLPGEWNKLESKSERENWLQKMLSVDKTDTLEYIPNGFVCGNFERQTRLNFHGNPELGYDKEKGLRDNGRFNIPMYGVDTDAITGEGHGINTTITGDNLNDFWDGYYSEPQNDQQVVPGDFSMNPNREVRINYTYVNHSSGGDYLASVPIVKFQLTNGVPELTWENDDQNVKVFKQRDTTSPEILRESPLENKIYAESPVLNYNVNDENFKSARYSIDERKTWNSLNQNGTKILDLPNGDYKLIIEAEDYFYNTSKDSVNFSVDKPNSLEKNILDSSVKVYPNPVSDYLKFVSEGNKEAQLRVYSIDGKEIENVYDTDGNIDLDVTRYSPGMYLFRYENSDGVKTGKVLKK